VVAVCMEFSLKFTYLWEHAALFTSAWRYPGGVYVVDVFSVGCWPYWYLYLLQSKLFLQSVPLDTEPGISLIILPLMRILQRNLKRTYLIV
jgi:uncharacterized membrane protein YoaT (DUF817 family)